jgi:hypothetical protein
MEDMESERGESARQEPGTPPESAQKRTRDDRRHGLFGGYQGPERRSGRDRRESD